jgi:protein arginine N-methyltransferase 5
MPVFNTPPSSKSSDDVPSSMSAHESFFASPSTPVATPSPLIDAIDAQPIYEEAAEEFRKADIGVVKIGQTSLHNPGGKSSWIGL